MSLLPLEAALERLLSDVSPITDEELVPLREATGRVLACDVSALRTQPDFNASAMDGYAVRSAQTASPPSVLSVIGESAAGHAFGGRIQDGEAVRIFTGAPVPDGADAVLIQEDAERLGERQVRVLAVVMPGENVRPAGNDFRQGDVLLQRHARLTPGAVALGASGGHPRLPALRRPRVAILATGSELVEPGAPLGPSQIVASNSYGLAALVEANGGEVLDCGIAPDRVGDIRAQIDRALRDGADIFVSIGGASVGDHDLAAKAFEESGATLDFWKVAMRPGKPLMAGRLGPMRLLGLPGNPSSCMVAATLFLRPLLRRLACLPPIVERTGRLGSGMRANGVRADFVRSMLNPAGDRETPEVLPLDRQDSSLLSIYARAQVLIHRPPHAPPASPGDACRFVVLD
ncbi:gephyrin-like molybdotransferase Glp [Aureimonas populi]|uniref:Molybdopterin molybdenumtransferase n=1 Tax=Aureimonas populi TaxID=1701758 RepID=A0ABW5CSM8_9HYPH|nr:gephyrin-like molybdotransferase Glp [Aureimonas populi]